MARKTEFRPVGFHYGLYFIAAIVPIIVIIDETAGDKAAMNIRCGSYPVLFPVHIDEFFLFGERVEEVDPVVSNDDLNPIFSPDCDRLGAWRMPRGFYYPDPRQLSGNSVPLNLL